MSADTPVQYVSDDSGKAIAVIVPIEVWREIESERETAYLLKSDAMRKRLLEAKIASEASRLTKSARSLEFDPAALDDLHGGSNKIARRRSGFSASSKNPPPIPWRH